MSVDASTVRFEFEGDGSKLTDAIDRAEQAVDGLEDRIGKVDDSTATLGAMLLRMSEQAGEAVGRIFTESGAPQFATDVESASTELAQFNAASQGAAAELAELAQQFVATTALANESEEVLAELAEQLIAVDEAAAIDLGRRLGLNADTVRVIREMHTGLRTVGNDTRELATWADRLRGKITELNTGVRSLTSSFVSFAKGAVGAFGAYFTVQALSDMAAQTVENVLETERLAKRNNMAVESYSALSQAIKASGADLGEFQSGMEAFAEKVEDPEQALRDLARQMEGLSHFEALQLGQEMGLSPSTVALLENGVQAYDDLLEAQRELGIVTEQDARKAREYRMAQERMGAVWESIRRDIANAVLPVFTKLFGVFEQLGKWVKENGRFLAIMMGVTAAIATAVFAPAILAAAAALWALIAPILAIAAPFILIGALIGLVIDDIMAFREGNDSVIGELSKKWPIVGKVINKIVDVIQGAFKVIGGLFDVFSTLITEGPEAAFEKLKLLAGQAINWLLEKFPMLGKIVDTFTNLKARIGNQLESITDTIGGWYDSVKAIIDGAVEAISKAWDTIMEAAKQAMGFVTGTVDAVKGVFGLSSGAGPAPGENVIQGAERAAQQVEQANAEPMNGVTSNAISNHSSRSTSITQNVGGVTVNTRATDGAAVGKELSGNLGSQMRSAIDEFDDGVQA